jgi:hypothetical protein
MQDDIDSGLATDVLQNGVTREYFDKVNKAIGLLLKFYERYLSNKRIQDELSAYLNDRRTENVKFCVLIDIMRCYDGLDHPTSFNTPEGVALMMLLDKLIGLAQIERYEQLAVVSSKTLDLIGIIPYINECSYALGNRYSLLLSSILEQIVPEADRLYRRLLYNLCKHIAEVDGVIIISEKDWLNEIALLNDDDPDNDIDIGGL